LSFYENVLNAPTLGISKVLINKTLPEIENRQRIVELFRRLNDGGTRLSSFDLVASILKGFSWEMEGFLREMLEKYQDIGLSQENLIKLIFLLQDDYNKEMASIESSDAEFAIRNRERIKVTLKSLKDFLIYSKVYDYYKDSNRSFIPLFFIVYHLFHKNIGNIEIDRFFDNYETGNSDFSLMRRWLFNSLINGVFRSKGAGWIPYKTGIRKILSLIKNYKNKVFPIDELFSIYTDHPITFTLEYTKENIDQLDSSFVYYVMYDLSRTNRMNDIDHIMPKNILESLNYPSEKINSIKNFQLLDYGTNRGHKNGKAFKDWLTAKEYVKDKEAYILLHSIPNDESLWVEEKFEEFEDKRADIILEKIFKYTK
jgi:hypothetical protein